VVPVGPVAQDGLMSIAPTTAPEQLTDEQVQRYRDDGFLILPDALSADEVAEINRDVVDLCRNPALGGTTGDESDEELLRRYLCIHYPHKLSSTAMAALTHPRIVEALTRVIGPNVKAMQSMLFIKSEGKPGQAWHQDEHFIPTRDRSLTAAWIALDDATIENGCLWVLPGSHRRGVLYPSREQSDPRFDCTEEAYAFPEDEADAIPVEVSAGTVLLFDGYLLHRSLKNSGPRGYRRALVNHYMSAESLLPWKEPAGTPIGEYDFRDIVLVAGVDPYAWKGTVDSSRAYSRAEKDGGCDR
jgi:phytanoyl-CoA hydroxylase